MKRLSPQADTRAAYLIAELRNAAGAMQNLAAHVERERAAARRDSEAFRLFGLLPDDAKVVQL